MQDKPAFDLTKTFELKAFKHERMLTSCKFSPDGKFVVAGSADNHLYKWDLETGEKKSIGGHGTWISMIAFAGNRLISADYQGGVKAWDFETGKVLWSIEAHAGWLKALAVSPDGKLIATGGRDKAARVWSVEDGKPVREFAGHAGYVFSAAFHPDGKSLATGDYAGKIRHWDLQSGKMVRELDVPVLITKNPEFLCDVGGVRALAFDPKGERLACSGLRDAKSNTFCPGVPVALVLDWATGATKFQTKMKDDKLDGPIDSIRFMPDGMLLGSAQSQSSGQLVFWKDQAEPVHVVQTQNAYEVDLHPDGLQMAAATYLSIGKGGNGRGDKRGDYVSHGGTMRILAMYAKPAPPPKPKPAPKK